MVSRTAALRAVLAALAAAMLASCSLAPTPGIRSKEYFSEARYGPASPRVATLSEPIRKGGGVYTVGQPYRVAGKTYIPRDNPRYSATGLASWYGEAFHGRMTANGEVYDLNALTAAHPTMPLPSYARVTNLENGRSVIVRVNDRGPFAENRIIDVSSATADILDFKSAGTARVKVDYVGPARMDGLDQKMLLASYREPGANTAPFARPGRPADSYAVAAAAMPAPVVREVVQPAVATSAPMVLTPAYASAPPTSAFTPSAAYTGDAIGPLILRTTAFRSYAEQPTETPAQQAAANLSASDLTTALTRAAARKASELEIARPGAAVPTVVQIGSFSDAANAAHVATSFGRFGRTDVRPRDFGGRTVQVVSVTLDPSVSSAAVVNAASAAGLDGAFVVSR
jgi:rare lipoprotein A